MKLCLLLIKLYWIKILYKLGALPNVGICFLTNAKLSKYFITWDRFSGDNGYPVPHRTKTPHVAYWFGEHKWKGEYGRLRYDLLCHIIKSVKNEMKGK